MKFSKQALLGTGVLLGGSILLYATVHQIMHTDTPKQAKDDTALVTPAKSTDDTSAPLTADIETEKNILAQKQKEREARVEEQEQAAQAYLTEQQRIEAEALARSRAENQLYANGANSVASEPLATEATVTADESEVVVQNKPKATQTRQNTQPPVTPKPAPVQAKKVPEAMVQPPAAKPAAKPSTTAPVVAKATPPIAKPAQAKPVTPARPSSYQVQRGEGLIGLSRRYDVPLDVLAAANNLSTTTSLRVGQTITIPSAAQVQRIRQEAAAKEQQRQQEIARKKQEALQKQQEKLQYQAAQDKLKQARQTVKETDAKGSFGVQVALAADEAKAQEIAKQLQAAGYRVKTSQTTRGVRVVVGPETGKVAALALKDKINNDPRVAVDNGWVLFW